jgi:hypothetical protein
MGFIPSMMHRLGPGHHSAGCLDFIWTGRALAVARLAGCPGVLMRCDPHADLLWSDHRGKLASDHPLESAMHRFWTCLSLGALLGTASCEHTGTGDDTGSTTVLNGSFSATIDGTAWTATGKVIVSEPSGTSLILDATSPTYVMKLTMAPITGFGSTAFSLEAVPTNGSSAQLTFATAKWSTANTGGTGNVSLTTLSSSRATGTFSFDAPPSAGSGSTATTHVSGKFDVLF